MRKTLLLLAVLAAAVAGTALLATRQAPRWTTDSDAALSEFERGLAADQKLYADEACSHYEHAAELDPNFAAAKLFLLQHLEGRYDESRKMELLDELKAIDLSTLSDRERFLIERQFAFAEENSERAKALLEEYIEENPKDPFALDRWCTQMWRSRSFDQATDCFQRLIKIDPNWVRAQNLLGYMAMAKGDFKGAEEQFEIYRYLAPDQANPHDSLGELLMLTGRWDEAQEEFEAALAVKPDFCASWEHLLRLGLLRNDFAEVERVLHRANKTGQCGEDLEKDNRCRIEVWTAYSAKDFDRTWEAFQSEICEGRYSEATFLAFKAALASGRVEEAHQLRQKIEELGQHSGDDFIEAALLFLDGTRLRFEGRPEEAAPLLRRADELCSYQDSAVGYFKLANQQELIGSLREAGQEDEADRLLAELQATNPALFEVWPLDEPPSSAAPRTADEGAGADPSAAPGE